MADAGPVKFDVKVAAQDIHRWLQDLGWDFEKRRSKYPSKYRFNPATREQFKLIVGERTIDQHLLRSMLQAICHT